MINYSTKKLSILSKILNLLVVLFLVVIPIILICWKYNIFTNQESTKVNGYALVFLIILVFVVFKYMDRLINYLPDLNLMGKHKGNINWLKYILKAIKALLLPGFLVVAMFLLKSDFELAYTTFTYMLASIITALLIENIWLSPIRFLLKADSENVYDDLKEKRKLKNK